MTEAATFREQAVSATAWNVLIAISLCHMINDIMQSMLAAIYPLLQQEFTLSYWQIGLMTGLAYWNDWINALYYVDDPVYYGIQNFLVRMMNNIQFLSSGNAAAMVGSGMASLPSTGIRMALAVVGVLPIVVIYPFLQKYLTKGVIMGAVKG